MKNFQTMKFLYCFAKICFITTITTGINPHASSLKVLLKVPFISIVSKVTTHPIKKTN